MRTACLVFSLMIATTMLASTLALQPLPMLSTGGPRETVTLFEEGFDSGLGQWTTADGTAPNNWAEAWSLSPTGAYSGQSWWMHDPALSGYTDHRYIVLDTPDIALPASGAQLSFQISWAMEDIGGTEDYDGWDGINVRLSTDQGDTWQLLSGSPAYTVSSLYGFGEVFGEGVGVPGWSGQSNGWQLATMSLDAWAGQSVRIRFAFASDDATNTANDTSWFGVRVDDITIAGEVISNGDGAPGDNQMTDGFSGVTSGDFWEHTSEQAHNGTGCMHCPVMPNLRDELTTPMFYLANEDGLVLHYWVIADLPDVDSNNDGVPDDYLEVLVRGKTEPAWTRLHWLSGISSPGWQFITAEDVQGDCDLSFWAGDSLQIKFVLVTDDDNDGGTGTGLWLDDIAASYQTHLSAPHTLDAVSGYETVELSWAAPSGGQQEGWVNWDDGQNYDSIGSSDPVEFEVAARFSPEHLEPYAGSQLTTIRFYPTQADCEYSLRVWTGSGYNPVMVRDQPVSAFTADTWNEVDLNEPLTITPAMTLWIGYLANTQGGFPLGCDDGPMVVDCGGWLQGNGSGWMQLADIHENFDYNWNIQGYIMAPDGRQLPMWQSAQRDREDNLSGYKLYRGQSPLAVDEPLATLSDPEQTSWTDATPHLNDENFYQVRAWYNDDPQQTSDPTNTASAFAPTGSMSEMQWDDGVHDSTYSPASGQQVANAFETVDATPMAVRQVEVYLTEVGTGLLPVRVWASDDGQPGELLADFAAMPALLHTGWNILDLPHAVQVQGAFYAGIVGTQGGEVIGVDSSVSDVSTLHDGTSWATYGDGAFMIRVWADTNLPAGPSDIPEPALGLANFPNPFNPETTISFTLPQQAHARLDVYNLRGQRVVTLLNDTLAAGSHTVTWQARGVASGVYMLRLKAGDQTQTRRALLLK